MEWMPPEGPDNRAEVDQGRATAERWGATVRELGRIMDALEARVPDLKLAPLPEKKIKELAESMAMLAKERIPEAEQDTPAARRECDPAHHRRRLRARASTARQAIASLLGTIGQGSAPYADAHTLARWKERQEAAKAFGEAHQVEWDGGSVSLWDVMETSRKARISALYSKMKGVDSLATKRGLMPTFITMTLPPKFHPNPGHGLPYGGAGMMDAPTPQETDAALASLWRRLRARASKSKINLIGPRVTEPHKDGCPHLHALLYPRSKEEAAALDKHMRALCPEPVPGRRIASQMVEIDREKSAPATYIMKYVLKALPAWEAEDNGSSPNIRRIAAWASERRLRRFAWVGIHGLGMPWQRILNIDPESHEIGDAPKPIFDAWMAMQAKDWGAALEHLGAVRGDGRERPRIIYADAENKYGETIKKPVSIAYGEDWTIPIKKTATTIGQRTTPHPDMVRDAMRALSDPWADWSDVGEVTLTVSDPRGPAIGGCDGEAGGRTGPPPAQVQTFTPRYRVGDIEILVME